MLRVTDVVRRHGPAYLERHGGSMMPSHVRAVKAITRCRTPEMGGHLAVCPRCGARHLLYHSCRHRACPACGRDTTARWIEAQRALLLPVPYFHVVFTLPDELRRLVRAHQTTLLPVLFQAAFAALAALAADPRYLGAHDAGALQGVDGLAIGDGPGRIYIVEPTGPIEDDPNLTDKKFPGNPTRSFRTRAPLRVIGEITDWRGHAPEQIQAMKDGLARLAALGVQAIED